MQTIDRQQIAKIVEDVIAQIGVDGKKACFPPAPITNKGAGVYSNMETAVEAAEESYYQLKKLTLEKRKEIIQSMRDTIRPRVNELAKLAVEETKMGRAEDKIKKNLLAIDKTPGVEDLESYAYSGDRGLTLVEMAPYGIIGAITPSTNCTETIICNGIGMVAAGNAVVFNPHPTAKKVTNLAVSILNEAIRKAGGPSSLLNTLAEPSIQSSQQLMKHPRIRLLVVTGGPAVVKQAMCSGKRTIAAGPGNPPVVVDETADIDRAAKSIITGASLDNNILCIAEKEIIVVNSVAEQLRRALTANGAYELNRHKLDQLMAIIVKELPKEGHEAVMNRDFVGRNVSVILEQIGIKVSDETRLAFAEVPPDHPLVYIEQLMPVLPLVRVRDVDEAITLALRAEQGNGHTAVMHSKSVENLSKMASVVNTSIFIKNAPSCAGLGFGGEGYTTYTIASPTGEGLTRARNFTRERRCVLVDYFRII